MAIDAIITGVKVDEQTNSIKLQLSGRIDAQGRKSLPGQEKMTIQGDWSYMPVIGDVIWGGSGSCRIERTNETIEYVRVMYTKLEEAKRRPKD